MHDKVLAFTAETNGLYGQAFTLAAVVIDNDEELLDVFNGRCPIVGSVDPRVQNNVVPNIDHDAYMYPNYRTMLSSFADFYLMHKDQCDIVVHMGHIVEANILRDMVEFRYITQFEGPNPLNDISGNLQQVGENPTSLDEYIIKYGICGIKTKTHNALVDADNAARIWMHLQSRRKTCE